MSYSCLPNMASIISAHNKKILPETEKLSNERKTCNCRNKNICPLDGSCLIESVIYAFNQTGAIKWTDVFVLSLIHI